MNMSIIMYFQTVILSSAFLLIRANGESESKSDFISDFPYIMYDTSDSWLNVITKLKNTGDLQINNILQKYNKTCHSTDEKITGFLRAMIIQHCISHTMLYDNFESGEIVLLKNAVKLGLKTGKTRTENADSNGKDERKPTEDKNSMEAIIKNLIDLQSKRNPKLRDEERTNMLDRLNYVIYNFVMEFMSLGLSDTRISNFLIELFIVMDMGKPESPDYFYRIILDTTPSKTKIDVYVESKDGINLMILFGGSNAAIERYYGNPPRSRQQIIFQNRLIANHFRQKCTRDKLPERARNVLNQAQSLKLNNLAISLEIFKMDIFNYKIRSDPGTDVKYSFLVNIRQDSSFSGIRLMNNDYKSLDDGLIDYLDLLLSLWLEEKILMSVVNDEMYQVLRKIFFYIDISTEDEIHNMELILNSYKKKLEDKERPRSSLSSRV